MSEFIGFDNSTAVRVLAATRKVEATRPGFHDRDRGNAVTAAVPPLMVIFRVTNTNPTQGFWRCRWLSTEVLSSGTPALAFTMTTEDGWAYGLSNFSLQQDVDYFGYFVGYKPNDGLAVFVTSVASVVTVKNTSAAPTSGVFYSGLIQNYRASTQAFNDGVACWVQDVNGNTQLELNKRWIGYIVGVHTDGKAIVLMRDTIGLTGTEQILVCCDGTNLQKRDFVFLNGTCKSRTTRTIAPACSSLPP